MADEQLDHLEPTSVRDHQASHRPFCNALQLDTSSASRWPLSPFDTWVATEGIDPNLLNLENVQTVTDTPSVAIPTDKLSTPLRFDDVGSSAGICATRPSTYATEEDWTRNQSLIRQFYLDGKKTLPDLMRVMESEHNFRATKKMYKSRITKWGLDKKNKENEMRAVVRKRKSRIDQGKHSIIRVRGRALSFTEVARYWHRKGVSIHDIITRRLSSETPEAVEITTPIPSPVLPPQQLAIPEYILRSVQNYIASFLEDGTWVGRYSHRYCVIMRLISIRNINTYLDFATVCHCFEARQFELGGTLLRFAAGKLETIVLAEDPYALFVLCHIIQILCFSRRSEIALVVLRQVSALSKVMLAGTHPLHHIYASLLSVASSQLEDLIRSCTLSMDNHFKRHLGLSDRSLLPGSLMLRLACTHDLVAKYRDIRPKPLPVGATEFGVHEEQRPMGRNQSRIGPSLYVNTDIEDMEDCRSAASEPYELYTKIRKYGRFMNTPECDWEHDGCNNSDEFIPA